MCLVRESSAVALKEETCLCWLLLQADSSGFLLTSSPALKIATQHVALSFFYCVKTLIEAVELIHKTIHT